VNFGTPLFSRAAFFICCANEGTAFGQYKCKHLYCSGLNRTLFAAQMKVLRFGNTNASICIALNLIVPLRDYGKK
jgi:hypothetical protein